MQGGDKVRAVIRAIQRDRKEMMLHDDLSCRGKVMVNFMLK